MRIPSFVASTFAMAAAIGTTSFAAAPLARAEGYPHATIETVPHLSADGFEVTPADGDSLRAVYRLADKELRLQINDAFVPGAGTLPGANGVTPASIGGCLLDETGLLISGWGIDAEGEEYAGLPGILDSAADADDAGKVAALGAWCSDRADLWQGFTSLARELEIEGYADQSAVLGPRQAAWTLVLTQARNLEALCLFAKHQVGQAAAVRDYFKR